MKPRKFTIASKNEGTLRKISGTNYWEVSEPFVWWLDYEDHSKWCIIVTKGFRTDLWSVPRILWSVFNPTEWLAFVLHDYLYSIKMIEWEEIERKTADLIMREALVAEWCKNPELFCLYYWVRLGWGKAYHKERKTIISAN